MLKVLPLMGCAWALVLNPEAHALPNPQLEELPEIEEVLQRAGWTMTPEMSAAYTQPGNIFDENNALLKRGRDCFEVKVGPPAAYASMEVNRSLEAGVRMRVLVAGGRAGLGIEKKLVFDTPKHRQIPRLDLRLNAACRGVFDELVATGEDISGAYVVTESLSAVVQKQECGSFDVKAGVFVVSGDAKIQQSCSQTSLEPVAVAYKRVPLLTVLKRANAASVVTATAPQTPGREHIARASVETQFDAVEEPTDIQSRLRKQRCDEEAKRNSVKVREARIDRAVAEAQTQAADALQRIESDLQACTQLKRGDRGRCIETLNSWLSKAENLKVSIPAGVERVDTACGQQEAVFESAERTVASSEVGRAQGLL